MDSDSMVMRRLYPFDGREYGDYRLHRTGLNRGKRGVFRDALQRPSADQTQCVQSLGQY